MINQQLFDYIKQQLQQGISQEQIKSSLMANGWQAQDIDEVFSSLVSPSQSLNPTDFLSQSQSFSSQPSKVMSKILLTVVSIIGGILIIGGGVFAYFNYAQSPEKIFQKMVANFIEVKSLEYSGEIKAEANVGDLLSGSGDLSQTQNKKNDFLINFAGKSDIQTLDNPKGLFSFDIKTDALTQEEFAFGLEIRVINKVIYFKLSNVPDLGFFDLSFLKNQWIIFDSEALKNQFGMEKIEERLEEQFKEEQKEQKLLPEQIEKVKLAVRQAKIIKITKKLPSEKIEGINTYHYAFTLDTEGVKKLFIEVGRIIEEDRALTEKELAELDESFAAVELPEGEIWIGKKDLLPYKISLTMSAKETAESEAAGKLTAMLLFKNYNKPVQIDIPSPVKGIEDILSEAFGGLLGGASSPEFQNAAPLPQSPTEKARDAKRQSDINRIQLGLEIFYSEQNRYPSSLNELYPRYLPTIPVDPSTKQPYQYQLQPNGTGYKVCTQLESTKEQKCVSS